MVESSSIKPFRHLWIFCVLFLFIFSESGACTGFLLKAAEGLIVARNTDLRAEEAVLVTNEKGIDRISYVTASQHTSHRWRSQYRSLTLNHIGVGFPNEGINEKGLVIAPFSVDPDRKYPLHDGKPFVTELEWIQFCLDSHSTVEEVIQSLSEVNIDRIIHSNAVQFLVCDKVHCTVVEGTPKRFLFHDISELPVITNDPYPESKQAFDQRQDTIGDDRRPGPYRRFLIAGHAANRHAEWEIEVARAFAFEKLEEAAQGIYTRFRTLYEPQTASIRLRRGVGTTDEIRVSVKNSTGMLTLAPKLTENSPWRGGPYFYGDHVLPQLNVNEPEIRKIKAHIEKTGSL